MEAVEKAIIAEQPAEETISVSKREYQVLRAKAEAYDLLATRQQIEQRINLLNQEIERGMRG